MKFDLVELLKYLGLHGRGAIIVLFIAFILWLLFSNNKVSNAILTKIAKRFSEIFDGIHHKKEEQAALMSLEIDNVLAMLRRESDATNAIVVRYRNGSYDSIGSSILKFSATNEKTKPGYLQISDQIQNMSRSLYGEFCDTLLKERHIFLKDKEVVKENPEFANIMKLFGNAEKFYANALITSKGQIVGFVCLVYDEPHKITDKRIDTLLTDAAARIVTKIESFLPKN